MTQPLPHDKPNRYASEFRTFVRASKSGLDDTLLDFWRRIVDLGIPFEFTADNDMAKFIFPTGRGFHITTSTKRFHRPKKTGKPLSVTVIMSGFKSEYNDPEDILNPCDKAGKIDCCYFGMGEEEAELAMFFIEQLVEKPRSGR